MIDNQQHYHNSDRFPSRDTLLWLNSLERVHNVSADYTVTNDDDYVIVDTTAGEVEVTLPRPINGRKLVIANFAGTNNVVLTSAANINGSISDLIVSPGVTIEVKDLGGDWLVTNVISNDQVLLQSETLKVGDVAGGDYSEFESDGTLRFHGAATVWQDIDFPIIIRTIGPNIPTLVALQGNITVPQWAINDFYVCEGQELVHQWKEGSEFQWHVHMVTNGLDATDRYVNWEIEWVWVNPNGVVSSTITTTKEVLIPANTPTKTMIVREIGLVTIAGTIGGHIYARLRRIALTTGGLTGPTNHPWCSMLQMHIECDTVGSRNITSKL